MEPESLVCCEKLCSGLLMIIGTIIGTMIDDPWSVVKTLSNLWYSTLARQRAMRVLW